MMIDYRSGFFADPDLAIALNMASTEVAFVLGLHRYGMAPGDEATFVIVDAEKTAAAVVAPPANRRLVQRGAIVPAPASQLDSLSPQHDNRQGSRS